MPDKIDFFEKADVNGSNSREVFSFLKQDFPGAIKWNFGKDDGCWLCWKRRTAETLTSLLAAKFLVDHEGKPYNRYSPTTNPEDMKEDIEKLLKRRNGNSPEAQ
jgi:glutathione peroxidase